MGYELRRWLADHLPADLTSGERLVILEIADLASDRTRRAYGSDTLATLIRRTGFATSNQLGKVLSKLAKRGLELRVPVTGKDGMPVVDSRGRLVYACRGRELNFIVPLVIPQGLNGCPTEQERSPSKVTIEASESRNGHPAGANGHPVGSQWSPCGMSMVTPQGDPSPQSPQDLLISPQESALARTVMTAVAATAEEAREMIKIIEMEHHPRSLPAYIAKLASTGDLGALLARVRAGGRAQPTSTPVPPSWQERRAALQCVHGMPGGAMIRHAAGTPACPQCRSTGGAHLEIEQVPAGDRAAAVEALRAQFGTRRPVALRGTNRLTEVTPMPGLSA